MTDPHHYHAGLPVHINDILDRVKRGLPVYWPRDPKPIDQSIYLAFADKPEGLPR